MERYKEVDLPNLKERSIFFDANILVYIFFVIDPNNWGQKNYSRIFSEIVKQGNDKVIDVTVISEVVNRSLRLDYKNYLTRNNLDEYSMPYKRFRESSAGKVAIHNTSDMLRYTILPQFNVVGKVWSKDDIDELLSTNGDFNDQLLARLCSDNDFVMLTNDVDFKDFDIDILSLNNKIK